MKSFEYVQYGCGLSAPSKWKNFDSSPTLYAEKLPLIGHFLSKGKPLFPQNVEYGDIVKGLPVPLISCSAIYCSHVLEHLSLDGCRTALKNTHKILKPGGTFRFVLPDLEHYARQYINDSSSEAALTFMKSTYLGKEFRNRNIKDFIYSLFSNSSHLWMWDYKSLYPEIKRAGFTEIRKAYFGDSSDIMFRDVENKERWVDCLGVECKKPV